MRNVNIFILGLIVFAIFFGCNKSSDNPASKVMIPINPAGASSMSAKSAAELHAEGLKFYNEGKYKEAVDAWLKRILPMPM